MRSPPPEDRFRLQPWHMMAGSILILVHLAAIAIGNFHTWSGPWPTPMGESTAEPPQFAKAGYRVTGPVYTQGLRIGTNSSYLTNRPGRDPQITFEFRLRDNEGKLIKVLRFPDEKANGWVQHRQSMLAMWLGRDAMMPPLESQLVAAPGKHEERRSVWRVLAPQYFQGSQWYLSDKEGRVIAGAHPASGFFARTLYGPQRGIDELKAMYERKEYSKVHEVSENGEDWEPADMLTHVFDWTAKSKSKMWLVRRGINTLPRNSPLNTPNTWSLLVAQSYGRYLCREYGAASAELVRISQPGYPPAILFMPAGAEPPPGFNKMESYFGKVAP